MNKTFPGTFPVNADLTAGEVDVSGAEAAQLEYADTGGKEKLTDGGVADGIFPAARCISFLNLRVNGSEKRFELGQGNGFGKTDGLSEFGAYGVPWIGRNYVGAG